MISPLVETCADLSQNIASQSSTQDGRFFPFMNSSSYRGIYSPIINRTLFIVIGFDPSFSAGSRFTVRFAK